MYDEQLKEELQAIVDASEPVNPSATRIELKLQDDAVIAVNENIVLEFVANQGLAIYGKDRESYTTAEDARIYRRSGTVRPENTQPVNALDPYLNAVRPGATRVDLALQEDTVLAINDNIVLEFVAGEDSSNQRLIIHDSGETFAIADFRNIYRKGSEGKLKPVE